MGTHLSVHSESYLMNTNMTGFIWLQKYLHPCALDESSLSIGRVKLRIHWINVNYMTARLLTPKALFKEVCDGKLLFSLCLTVPLHKPFKCNPIRGVTLKVVRQHAHS